MDNFFGEEEKGCGKVIYNQFTYQIDCRLYEMLRCLYGSNYKEDAPKKTEYVCCSYMEPEKIEDFEWRNS